MVETELEALVEAESARAARVSREVIIRALHQGMRRAIQEFEQWTDGESLADWGVEPVLTTACARAVCAASRRAGGQLSVTLEQDFGSLLDWSGRRNPAGRPTASTQRLLGRAGRKVDLVVWNGNYTPRAVVEVKRADAVAGLLADAERLTDFVRGAGKAYGGSLRRGFLALVVQHKMERTAVERDRRLALRVERLKRFGTDAGFRVRIHGPQTVSVPALRDYCCVQTLVVEFSLPRD